MEATIVLGLKSWELVYQERFNFFSRKSGPVYGILEYEGIYYVGPILGSPLFGAQNLKSYRNLDGTRTCVTGTNLGHYVL